MLKYTNTFYRFKRFTCDKFDETYVWKFSHLNYKGKICSTRYASTGHIRQFHCSTILLKQHRKYPLKVNVPPFSLDDNKKRNPMSGPLQSTTLLNKHDVSTVDFDEWQQKNAVNTSVAENSSNASNVIPPNFRKWETIGKVTKHNDGTGFRFKVLSYNVLAQCLLEWHPYIYTACSPHNLKWDMRASRLYNEIISYDPDILCLQEVQTSHLATFYSKFENIGYTGIFKRKTGIGHDGCAIYFKKSLFEMKDHVSVEFHQPEMPILNRDNIGIIVKLSPHHLPNSPVVIATTHLLYNPRRTDVRLAQMQLFLAEIDRFAYYNNGQESGHHPIILTGDFNSTPDSVVVSLLDKGRVHAAQFRDSSDWKHIAVTDNCQYLSVYLNRQNGQNIDFKSVNPEQCLSKSSLCDEKPPILESYSGMFNSSTIGQSLYLKSVYDKFKNGGVFEATTFQDYWVTVDYIYFSYRSSIKLVERLRLPTSSECQVLGSLPNDMYASDHLALVATFELRPSVKSKGGYRGKY